MDRYYIVSRVSVVGTVRFYAVDSLDGKDISVGFPIKAEADDFIRIVKENGGVEKIW